MADTTNAPAAETSVFWMGHTYPCHVIDRRPGEALVVFLLRTGARRERWVPTRTVIGLRSAAAEAFKARLAAR